MAGLIGKGISVILALRGLGVWALVWGEILSSVMQSALVWFFHPYRPHLRFDRALARELFGFGKHITGSNVLVFGITNVDDLFVGRMLGTTTLGVYGVAYDYSNLPATQITRIIGRVMFPAFFRIQTEIERLKSVYFRLVHAISIVSFPITAATVVFAQSAILIIAGEKWAAAIVPLQLLSIYGLLRAVAGNMAGIMQAGNRANWLFYLALWRFFTMLLLLYPSIRLGMAASDRLIELLNPPPFDLDPKLWGGMIGVCVLSNVVSVVDFFIAAWLTNRILGSSLFDYARMFGPLFGVAVVASVVGKLVQAGALGVTIPLVALIAGGASLVLVYGLLLWLFDRPARVEVAAAIALIRRRLRSKAAPTDPSP
jgi:O-antigen/teichoic acid export membrane protein